MSARLTSAEESVQGYINGDRVDRALGGDQEVSDSFQPTNSNNGRTMRKLRFLCVTILTIFATAGMAQADEVACFDWSCDSDTLVCTFDATCSTPDSGLVSYRWNWGDSTSTNNTQEIPLTHAYNQAYATVKLTILMFGAPGESVTCDITIRNVIGPAQPTSGRCSSE